MRGWLVAEKRFPGAYASPGPNGNRDDGGLAELLEWIEATSNAGRSGFALHTAPLRRLTLQLATSIRSAIDFRRTRMPSP